MGIHTLKVVSKGFRGIAVALSSSDLLEVLHRFYPDLTATSVQNATP